MLMGASKRRGEYEIRDEKRKAILNEIGTKNRELNREQIAFVSIIAL
jgi:hypothetical protein